MARTRITLGQGIYQDAHGITVIARIGTRPNLLEAKARFPLVDGDGIPYSKKNNGELVRCYLQLLEDLRTQRRRDGGDAGTLGAAIEAWCVAFPKPERVLDSDQAARKRAYRHQCLAHWRTATVARVPVADLKRSEVRAQLEAWRAADVADSTCNHRKQALTEVLRWTLGADDDADVRIVTDGIKNFAGPEAEARGIPMPIVMRLLATMPDRGRAVAGGTRPEYSETKIRMRVMFWTGLARKSMIRLERAHVKFQTGKIYYPPRRKGKAGTVTPGVWVDLLPQALEALRDYDRAGLWGRTFSKSSMRQSWLRAVKNLRAELAAEGAETGDRTLLEQYLEAMPDNPKPYDARHSFLTDAYAQSGDLKAVKELGQHAELSTTERYTKAAVPARVASAVEKMRAKWAPDTPKPGTTVRNFQVVTKG